MKRILIVAYYYPPNNNIPSWRPYSWAKYFSGKENTNAEVHVVCRYWDGSEKTWEEQIKPSPNQRNFIDSQFSNQSVHYIIPNPRLKKLLRVVNALWPVRKLFHFVVNVIGHHHIEVDTFFSFRKYIKQQFPENYFDAVIVTSPPLNVIRLGYWLRKRFPKAFFVADFRDLWTNEILRDNYNPSRKDKFHNNLSVRSLQKWLKKFDLVTSVSKALTDKLAELGNTNTAVITNGFEDDMFLKLENKPKHSFNITSVGTIYSRQPYEVLVNGIIDFVKRNNYDPSIRVEFIGAKPYNMKLVGLLESELPAANLTVTDRIDRTIAIQKMKDASVLVYPGWIGYKGIVSGKIFEYLAAGNNILIAPPDNDVISELMYETGAGVCLDTRESVEKQLQKWFDEWKQDGQLAYHGNADVIKGYSRQNQAKKLSNLIDWQKKERELAN